MELELDLKLSRTKDDLCATDFWIAKDQPGPMFISRETGTMFVLTAHLRGYTKENIKIDINEDGTLISISGNKVVQEEEPNMKGFMKVYKIPSGVILDEIKADYNDDDSTLTIYMPKQKKGITGSEIEEVEDIKQKHVSEESLMEEQASEDVQVQGNDQQEEVRHERIGGNEIEEVVSKLDGEVDDEEALPPTKKCKKDKEVTPLQKGKGKEIEEEKLEGGCERNEVNEVCETEQGGKGEKGERSIDQHEVEEKNNNKCMLCAPCFFIGSTLFASLVAMLFRLVKAKRQ